MGACECCTCYPHGTGLNHEQYEGPQPWCDVHGLPSAAYARGLAAAAGDDLADALQGLCDAEDSRTTVINGVLSTRQVRALLARYATAPLPTEEGDGAWSPLWDHCYEDMGSDPCGAPPVGSRLDPEEGKPYPVCRVHLRPPIAAPTPTTGQEGIVSITVGPACPYCDRPGNLLGSGETYRCDDGHYWKAAPTEDGGDRG